MYIYISLFSYHLISKTIISDNCTDICLQFFFFPIVFFGKRKKTLAKPFTIWKWKHVSKKNHILKMKAHSKTHLENENMLIRGDFFATNFMGFWHCDSVWSVLLLDASFVPVSYDSIKKPGRATKSRPLRTSIFNNKCTLLNCYCTLSSSALNLMLHYTYKSMLGLWRLKMASGERICWSYERSPLLGIFFVKKTLNLVDG